MRRIRLVALAAATFSLLSLAAPAGAQSLDDKLRAQLRSVLGQLHDLQNAQASLEAEKAAAEQERDALKAKLATGAGRVARPAAIASSALQAALDQEKAQNGQLTQALQQAQAETQKYKDAYAHIVDSDQQVHAERDRSAQEVREAAESLAVCETKNIQLVKIGRDVMAAYARIGVKDALERGEPMIGLKRVKMERIAQDYADKVYEAKFDPRTVKHLQPGSAAPTTPPSAAPAQAPPAAAPKP